jgi:hypothetical protein
MIGLTDLPGKGERGWLVPYLIDGDDVFGHGRIDWWARVDSDGRLPDEPIPQIAWRSSGDTSVRADLREMSDNLPLCKGAPLSPKGAADHIHGLIEKMHGGWESLTYLVRWIAWGLAVGRDSESPRFMKTVDEEWNEILYREFQLQRLVAADTDVLGSVLAERYGKGSWNPSAFFPTLMEICEMMAQMTMGNCECVGKDPRLQSVMDPCVGTGRMLLAASNFSVNLFGVDIDPLMVDACSINMALFAPWAVYQTPSHRYAIRGSALPLEPGPVIEQADAAREEQGHPPLPKVEAQDGAGAAYVFNRHGQGELFSVPSEKEKR